MHRMSRVAHMPFLGRRVGAGLCDAPSLAAAGAWLGTSAGASAELCAGGAQLRVYSALNPEWGMAFKRIDAALRAYRRAARRVAASATAEPLHAMHAAHARAGTHACPTAGPLHSFFCELPKPWVPRHAYSAGAYAHHGCKRGRACAPQLVAGAWAVPAQAGARGGGAA